MCNQPFLIERLKLQGAQWVIIIIIYFYLMAEIIVFLPFHFLTQAVNSYQ